MEKTSTNQPTELPNARTLEKTLKSTMVTVFCLAIVALFGAGFGIYGTIQANRALSYLEEEELATNNEDTTSDSVDDSEESSFVIPTEADDIVYISVTYNDGQDYIDIANDGTDSSISYYDDSTENTTTTDVTEIVQYVFDNNLDYLGDNEYNEEDTWSLDVETEDGYSYVGGTGSAPEWFNDLLKKLDADKNGYQSQK